MILFETQKVKRAWIIMQQILSFGAGEGVARGLNWGMMALLPLFLSSTEEYGYVGLLVSIEVLVSNISLVGLDRAILRFYGNKEWHGKFLKSIFVIWASFAWIPLAILLVLYLVGWEKLFGIPLFPHLFLLLVGITGFNLNILCTCIGRAKRDLGIFLRFRLCYMILKFVFVLLMAKIFRDNFSYIVGGSLSAFVMLQFTIPFLHKNKKTEEGIDVAIVRKLLIFGWPLICHVISGNILSYFSRFFLQTYSTTKDVGIFTFAFTLGSSIYIFYAVLAIYFEPRIYSHADDKIRSEQWLGIYTNICIASAAAGGAILLTIYPYLLSFLSADYSCSRPIIALILGTILIQPIYLEGNYRLTVYKKTHHIALSSFIGAGLNIIFSILLIPSYGIWGAAIALYVSSCILSVYILVISMYCGGISLRHQLRSIPTYTACAIGSLCTVITSQTTGFTICILLLIFLVISGLVGRLFLIHIK